MNSSGQAPGKPKSTVELPLRLLESGKNSTLTGDHTWGPDVFLSQAFPNPLLCGKQESDYLQSYILPAGENSLHPRFTSPRLSFLWTTAAFYPHERMKEWVGYRLPSILNNPYVLQEITRECKCNFCDGCVCGDQKPDTAREKNYDHQSKIILKILSWTVSVFWYSLVLKFLYRCFFVC